MKRVLIVLLGSIGDVARALPLAAILKSNGIERISWVVEPKSAELVKLNRYVDRVIVFDRATAVSALPKCLSAIRSERYDLTIDLQRHLKSGLFSLFSGADRRIGFHRRDAKEFNWLFNSLHIEYFGEDRSKLEHYLLFAKTLGFAIPDKLDFGLEPNEIALTSEIPAGAVALVLGSSWLTKDWHVEGYRRLVALITKELPVVLVGDRSRLELAKELSQCSAAAPIINLAGRTSLTELVSVLAKTRIGIGPDSGPGHIMAALGKPYVALIGPTNPARVAPYGSADFVVTAKVPCAPCQRRICPGLGQICMRLITPELVWNKAHIALSQSAR